MSDAALVVLAGLTGVGLGGMFFGGLWWTVRAGIRSTRPALWFLGSALIRMSATLAGFFLVSRGSWERLVACLLGFVLAKAAVAGVTRPTNTGRTRSAAEANNAP